MVLLKMMIHLLQVGRGPNDIRHGLPCKMAKTPVRHDTPSHSTVLDTPLSRTTTRSPMFMTQPISLCAPHSHPFIPSLLIFLPARITPSFPSQFFQVIHLAERHRPLQ